MGPAVSRVPGDSQSLLKRWVELVVDNSLRVRSALAGLLLLTSAASAADSKTGWWETKTPHVTVKTDLSLEDARRAVVLAEQTRTALLALGWPGSKLDQDRIELIVFSNHQEFEG